MSSSSNRFLRNRAGFPPTTWYGSTSFVTTEPAAIMAPLPIFTPGIMTLSRPIQTSLPMTVSPLKGSWAMWGGTASSQAPPKTAKG